MKTTTHFSILVIGAILVTGNAFAAGQHKGAFETCFKAAQAVYQGEVLTLEAEISEGKPIYEFDIKDKSGKEWEVECDAKTGKIIETEQEVEASDPAFRSKAKVSMEDAQKTALAKFPGEVSETETAIEANGSLSYEFDIKTKDGKEIEVEVDATSGKIVETEEEIFQIGKE